MEVESIADYARSLSSHLDNIMQDAVDQLEALTDAESLAILEASCCARPSGVAVQFGNSDIDAGHNAHLRRFDFGPHPTWKKWSGPRYESYALHKRIPKARSPCNLNQTAKAQSHSSSNMTEKKHGRHEDHFSHLPNAAHKSFIPRPKTKRSMDKSKTLSNHPVAIAESLTQTPPRNPPLTLLTLAPELRNQIWSILAVSATPLAAQLRCIQPRPKLHGSTMATIRRFPLEPVVARVNRQVQQEVLSIFYGSNTFTFEHVQFTATDIPGKPESLHILRLTAMMTSSLTLWKPQRQLASYLRKVEVKLCMLTWGRMGGKVETGWIVFSVQKVHCPKMQEDLVVAIERTEKVKVKGVTAGRMRVCLCEAQAAAERTMDEFRKDLIKEGTGRDLIDVLKVFVECNRSPAKPRGVDDGLCVDCGLQVGIWMLSSF